VLLAKLDDLSAIGRGGETRFDALEAVDRLIRGGVPNAYADIDLI
jgi:hypothetical protein